MSVAAIFGIFIGVSLLVGFVAPESKDKPKREVLCVKGIVEGADYYTYSEEG